MDLIADIGEPRLRALIEGFVAEDVGRGDLTTRATVPVEARGKARIDTRTPCLVAGLDAAHLCFEVVSDVPVEWDPRVSDGHRADAGATLATIGGPLAGILTAERTALNLLARLCGVATLTARFVAAVSGTPVRIVDTRKTTPGLRLLEKYAVRAGGGGNHRFGLDDGVLIKDNHIVAAGGIAAAVRRAIEFVPHGLRVQVEVTTLDELDEALVAGADAVLLDNMSPATATEAVARAGGKVTIEASGGITLENVRDYAVAGVDLISVGALTHSAPAVDLTLEVES
jgi:nicotinate-nucleotide pyrophosphorylase (carboxylating)